MLKTNRFLRILPSVIFFIYITILTFPQIVFGYSIKYKSFEIYTHAPLGEEIIEVLDNAERLILKSDLYHDNLNQKVFICNSFTEFTFFVPTARKAFAVNYPVLNNVFLAKSDIKNDIIIRNNPNDNFRTLSSVLAHESVHTLLEDYIGFFDFKALPNWKNEGYCEFIANEGSYPFAKGVENFCNQQEDFTASYKYFMYRIYMTYLLNTEKENIRQILKKEYDLEELKKGMKKEYCN